MVKNSIVWFNWPLEFDSGHSVNRTGQFSSPCLWGAVVLDRSFQMMKHFYAGKKNKLFACFKCFDVSGRRLKTICTLCDKRNHLIVFSYFGFGSC